LIDTQNKIISESAAKTKDLERDVKIDGSNRTYHRKTKNTLAELKSA
jgi:hypothetical protein